MRKLSKVKEFSLDCVEHSKSILFIVIFKFLKTLFRIGLIKFFDCSQSFFKTEDGKISFV